MVNNFFEFIWFLLYILDDKSIKQKQTNTKQQNKQTPKKKKPIRGYGEKMTYFFLLGHDIIF